MPPDENTEELLFWCPKQNYSPLYRTDLLVMEAGKKSGSVIYRQNIAANKVKQFLLCPAPASEGSNALVKKVLQYPLPILWTYSASLTVYGPFHSGEDMVDGITTDIVMCLISLPKIRIMELDLVRLIGVSRPVINRISKAANYLC